MLNGKIELKDEILFNRNRQVRELSEKLEDIKKFKVNKLESKRADLLESIDNLTFLLDKKDKEISSLKNSIIDFEQSEGFIRNILDNPSLTDNETVTEIRKIF